MLHWEGCRAARNMGAGVGIGHGPWERVEAQQQTAVPPIMNRLWQQSGVSYPHGLPEAAPPLGKAK